MENTVGKGEIARYEQFLLFPLCFQKACFSGASKGIIVWEWVKETTTNEYLQLLVKSKSMGAFVRTSKSSVTGLRTLKVSVHACVSLTLDACIEKL